MKIFPSLVLAVLGFFVSGCVYIPGDFEKPFGKVVTEPIKPGVTTRTDILATIGDPLVTYREDRIFIYRGHQNLGYLICATPCGGSGGAVLDRPYYFVIEFDQAGTVTATNRFKEAFLGSTKNCTGSGYCLGAFANGPPLFAPPKEDATVKRFLSDPQACIIYIALSVYHQSIFIDGKELGLRMGRPGRYYRLRVEPGRHRIQNWEFGEISLVDELVFNCRAGSTRFIKLGTSGGIFSPVTIELQSEEEGRKTIMGMKLLVEWRRSIFFNYFR